MSRYNIQDVYDMVRGLVVNGMCSVQTMNHDDEFYRSCIEGGEVFEVSMIGEYVALVCYDGDTFHLSMIRGRQGDRRLLFWGSEFRGGALEHLWSACYCWAVLFPWPRTLA